MVMVVRGGASSLAEDSAVLLRFVVILRLDVVVLVQLVSHAVKDRVPHEYCRSHGHPSQRSVTQHLGFEFCLRPPRPRRLCPRLGHPVSLADCRRCTA